MKAEKEYIFKPVSIIFDVIMAAAMAIGVLIIFSILPESPIGFLLTVTIPAAMLYFQVRVLFVVIQYHRYDRGKKIIINADRTELTLIRGHYRTTITSNEVDRVEVYQSKDLGKLGTYNYMVIYTANQPPILITQFTIQSLIYDQILQKFLRPKPRTYIKSQFNMIDETVFQP